MRRLLTLFLTWLGLTAAPLATMAQASRTVAVFPVELWDTSGEGTKPGQAERLALATRTLARLLEGSGRYRSIDLGPFAVAVAATEPRYACNGCWRSVARAAGAETAVLAVVHKVSTLISAVDIFIADLTMDTYIAHAQGQFRGDDDRAYVRAFEFLVRERLLPDTGGPPPGPR